MSGEAFDRDKRLLTSAEYGYVFDSADIKVSDRHFLLLARKSTLGRARLGLVVAKKNIRMATRRNRIKRVARETFRKHQQSLDSLDIVFLARRGFDTLPPALQTQRLNGAWDSLVEKLGSGR